MAEASTKRVAVPLPLAIHEQAMLTASGEGLKLTAYVRHLIYKDLRERREASHSLTTEPNR